jgi:hybrid cluster-associated redox disulfide protein
MAKITRETPIGEILAQGPKAREVMTKVFGPGCFGCPNSKTKTLEFGATMHGHDPDEVARELNEALARE